MNDTKTQINFRVWYQGSNMPGYMPDEPPHPCESEESARESIADDIERDIDNAMTCEGEDSEQAEIIEQLQNLQEAIQSGRADCGTVGNRHYFLSEDSATTEELESADCEPSDYQPILDEWIDSATLDALESANLDVTIVESQTRYSSAQSGDEWTKCKFYDDSFGRWFIGKRECGAWIVPGLIIRAKSWEDAYGIFEDESSTVPEDELHEAYDMSREEFEAKCAERKEQHETGEDIDYPELAEGYSHQSNATGTGIVYTADIHLDSADQSSQCGETYNQLRFKVTTD